MPAVNAAIMLPRRKTSTLLLARITQFTRLQHKLAVLWGSCKAPSPAPFQNKAQLHKIGGRKQGRCYEDDECVLPDSPIKATCHVSIMRQCPASSEYLYVPWCLRGVLPAVGRLLPGVSCADSQPLPRLWRLHLSKSGGWREARQMARSEEHQADLGLCQTLPSPYLCAHMIQPPASCWYPGTEAPQLQPSPKPAISRYLPHVRSKFRRTSACSCIACIESTCSLRGHVTSVFACA